MTKRVTWTGGSMIIPKHPCRECSEEPTICYGGNPCCSDYAEYKASIDAAWESLATCDQCIWSTQDGECQGQCLREEV